MDAVKAHHRHDITDELWNKIAPFFPNRTGKRGRPAGDNRRFFQRCHMGHALGCVLARSPSRLWEFEQYFCEIPKTCKSMLLGKTGYKPR